MRLFLKVNHSYSFKKLNKFFHQKIRCFYLLENFLFYRILFIFCILFNTRTPEISKFRTPKTKIKIFGTKKPPATIFLTFEKNGKGYFLSQIGKQYMQVFHIQDKNNAIPKLSYFTDNLNPKLFFRHYLFFYSNRSTLPLCFIKKIR